MITIDQALTIATDNGVKVTDDHIMAMYITRTKVRSFWCYSTSRRVQVVQDRAGSKHWSVQLDTLFTGTRAQCIVEATRFCKVGAWK